MPKTRGGLSASPSTPTPRPHQAAMGGAASPPIQAPAIPPSERGTPSQRRYPTRRPPTEPVPPADQAQRPASRPPAKRTKFSGPGEPSHVPQIQQHLSMQTPLGHDTSAPSEPLVPDEESLPVEQPIPEEEIRAEPSHDPTHI
eukprot:XP_010644188.1 PREDICTED: vegetative cell wall protein gp1-like [Vitis vinifera]